jgi:cytochrome c oxidase subunit 4
MAETAVATQAPATEHVRRRPYRLVFGTLAAVTALELAITTPGYFPAIEHTLRVVVLIVLSTMKASLVAAYYMHLRYEPRWLLLIPFGGLALVAVLVAALTGTSTHP